MKLAGKVAVVTGAARGIGEAIVKKFASEGASVVVAYNTSIERATRVVDEIKAQGGTAIAIKADVTHREEVQNLVKTTLAEFGAIHILVNNAGIWRGAPLLEMTEEDWDATQDVDLRGSFFCIQAALGHMIEQRYGKIINISSTMGNGTSGTEEFANYAAAKGGVIQLTKATARVGGPYGINVNCIAPGTIITDIQYDTLGTKEKAEEFFENRRKLSVLGRVGEPDDIANLAVFLTSDDSKYITGQVINCDGGRIDRM